uniref:ATP synthase subunit a n=1 Tax=Cucujoidea sp. 4 KM-2017 TaxID=2219378 RepID=A0A346RFY5_9CUCU|nr:ATP synthase F0 subunit 6 [Cucujoidea sp. 4 KM-2017]
MMSNLFSSFDPSTIIFSLNWISSLMILICIPLMYWFTPNRFTFIIFNMLINLHKEFFNLTKIKNSTLLYISLFFFILINNVFGLFPYIFTSSSHMIFTLSLALPLWVSFMVFGWTNNTYHMFAHLMPQGTPGILMPFMVCIETISNIIRPGTLAVRLMANMVAGHLLMTLLGNTGPYMNYFLWMMLIVQIMLIFLESAVAFIQSYVFAVLSTLYSSETYYEQKP